MAAFPEEGDEAGEQSSVATGSSHRETDRGRALSESHTREQNQRATETHPLIESGCIREVAVRMLLEPASDAAGETTSSFELARLTPSAAQQAIERIQQLEKYEQMSALVEKHGGTRPTASQQTLAAHLTTEATTWEIVSFQVAYPTVQIAYPLFARSIDRDIRPVTAIIDPGASESDSTTVTAFEITTERVVPTQLSLDKQLPGGDVATDTPPSKQIGYQIAINWFVS